MSSLVRPLNDSLAYILCPGCRDNGNPNVNLQRDNAIGARSPFRCPVNASHVYDGAQLTALGAAMVPASEIVMEQPDPRSMAYKIFLLPATWERFNQKFKGRVHITIATLLEALIDGQFLIITGEDAAKLKAKGLNNSQQILAALDGIAKLESDLETANARLGRLMEIMKAAGAGT